MRTPQARRMALDRDLVARRKDGSTVPVEISLAPLFNGQETLVIAAVRDVTERRRMQEALRRSNTELGSFAAAAAHDLKAPLTAMSGYAEWLQGQPTIQADARALRAAAAISAAGGRLASLIEALLAYAQAPTAGTSAVVDPQAVLPEVLLDLEPLRAAAGVRITYEELPPLRVRAPHLRQLFSNLLANALHHGGAGVHVHVSAQRVGTVVRLCVQDNGPGLDPAARDQLFRPFVRGQGAAGSGHGLGLATCQRIVDGYGGRIWAEAAPGGGALFCCELPSA